MTKNIHTTTDEIKAKAAQDGIKTDASLATAGDGLASMLGNFADKLKHGEGGFPISSIMGSSTKEKHASHHHHSGEKQSVVAKNTFKPPSSHS